MPVQVIFGQSVDFASNFEFFYQVAVNTTFLLVVTGTAWTNTAVGNIGFRVTINGVGIGESQVWANQKAFHMTVPTLFVNATLLAGRNLIKIEPLNGNTLLDANDHFTVNFMQ